MTRSSISSPSQEIVALLKNPNSYDEQPSCVEVIETHISWVFLTNRFAYKLKKPVRFEFLDFSTPEARRQACEAELRLNQRLAQGVYLSIVPVTYDDHRGFELHGDGRAVDYVVKMRRLRADQTLAQMIVQRRLRAPDIDAVCRFLIDFYTRLPPKVVQVDEYYQRLVRHCRANRDDLLRCLEQADHPQIRRVIGAQQRYLTLGRRLFYDRVRNGRVVDGHGDLRAEHVYLKVPPAVIDCVEFSRELREVDVLDELCFLAMDCRRLGNQEVGRRLIASYERATGDHPPESLLSFYKCYRACVRAKVAALRIDQAGEDQRQAHLREARQYLSSADHFARRLGPPVLAVVGGLMGSGKSTLAAELASSIGATLLRTDTIRKQLFGSSTAPADYGADHYRDAARQQVYDELLRQAEEVLEAGCSAVVDGTFLTNGLRHATVERAERHGAAPILFHCECPREVALARIAARPHDEAADSEARPELLDDQLAQFEPLDPTLPAIRIDTTSEFSEELEAAHAALRDLLSWSELPTAL